MTYQYFPNRGCMVVSFHRDGRGYSYLLQRNWTVSRIERYLKELEDMYGR